MNGNKNPLRLPLNLSDYAKAGTYAFSLDGFTFSEEEKRILPDLLDLGDLALEGELTNAGEMYTLLLAAQGEIHLRDCHNGEKRAFAIDDEVEILISPLNPDESDIFPDEDGIYDLRGSVLALLFDAIPKNYSEVPLKKVSQDNYVIMSEEEYWESKQKNSSPFADLDDTEFPS